MQFINKAEKIERYKDGTVYLYIKGLDLSSFPNKTLDNSVVRRVKMKYKRVQGSKKFIILDVEDTEFWIQVSNQVFRKTS